MNKLRFILGASALIGSSVSYAIPLGIQTDVSDAQIAAWGWEECHRSGSIEHTEESEVTDNCSGAYLAMGVWDASLGAYGVVGAGSYDTVTKITYINQYGDDNVTVQNWSNGLNWYRTATNGSWGFSTSAQTALHSADLNLQNGYQSYDSIGTAEVDLAAGLSFNTSGEFLTQGWAYNTDGNNFQNIYGTGDQRVFWQYSAINTPAPSIAAIMGIGIAGIAFSARLRTRQS